MLVNNNLGRPPGLALHHREVPGTIRPVAHPPTVRRADPPYETRYLDFGAMEVTAQLVNLSRPMPSLVAWGRQMGDALWADVPPMLVHMVGVSDQVLAAVERYTFGHGAGNIMIVTREPVMLQALEQVFEGSYYSFVAALGLSNPLDSRMEPTIYFGALGIERDQADPDRGGVTADMLARQLRGVPAVAIASEPTQWRADLPFQRALRSQILGVTP